MTRRELITAAGMTAASYSCVMGANDRISIGVIGCGNRGNNEIKPVFENLNGPFSAVCDLWRTRAEKSCFPLGRCEVFTDHRRLLELPALDAVVIATSDH